jgi:hypothetical protein
MLSFLIFVFNSLSNLKAQSAAVANEKITAKKMRLLILPSRSGEDDPDFINNEVVNVIAGCATELGRFEIIDRGNLDKILQEHALQLSGVIDDSTAINLGRLATARQALMINVLNFSQRGVPPATEEKKEEDDKSLLEEIITGVLLGGSDEEKYENNILTYLAVQIRMIDVETGRSLESADINLEHTGGNRGKSRAEVIKKLRKKTTRELKELYMLSSEVISAENTEVLLYLGSGVGVKKGTLFELVSPDRKKIYEDETVTIPGRSAGIVCVKDISDESNRSTLLRQWRPIKPGYRALEYPKSIHGLQFLFSPGVVDSLLSFGAEFHWQPIRQWNWGFGLRYSRVTDSFGDKDHGFGFGGFGSMIFLNSPKFKIIGRAGLDFDIVFRKDDENKTVNLGIFSAPVGVGGDIYLSRKSDIFIFAGYRFSGRADGWQRSTEGEESKSGVWNNGAPQVNISGIFVFVGYKIIFL